MKPTRSGFSGTAIFLAVLALVLLFTNLDLFSLRNFFWLVFRYWPMIFVGVGMYRFLSGHGMERWRGIVPIIFGLLLQSFLLGLLPGEPLRYWPMVFLLWGIWLIVDRPAYKRSVDVSNEPTLRLDEMLNVRTVRLTGILESARVECTAASLTLDLTKMEPAAQNVILEVDCFLSRLIILLSTDMRVEQNVKAFFGKVRHPQPGANGVRTLVLTGSLLFGRVHVRQAIGKK